MPNIPDPIDTQDFTFPCPVCGRPVAHINFHVCKDEDEENS